MRRVDDAQEQAHRLARPHRHREDAAGGEQDEAEGDRARERARRRESIQASLLSSSGVGQGGEAVVEQRMQLGDAGGAEPLVEGELGPLPFALRLERAWRDRAR